MKDAPDGTRAIDRAIDVLECFAGQRGPLSIGDIERHVRLSRPTLYRILATLIRRRLVRKDGEPPRYRLDIGIGLLAEIWVNSLDIVQLAMPFLNELVETYDETVALYLRDGNNRLCVAEVPSRQPLSYSRGLGYSGSLIKGASGLAILAHLSSADVTRILAQESGREGSRSVRRKLSEIVRAGFALSRSHIIVGAQAIASPVFDRRGSAIGSLGLFGPSARFPQRRISECAKSVKASTARLSEVLGHRVRSSQQRLDGSAHNLECDQLVPMRKVSSPRN